MCKGLWHKLKQAHLVQSHVSTNLLLTFFIEGENWSIQRKTHWAAHWKYPVQVQSGQDLNPRPSCCITFPTCYWILRIYGEVALKKYTSVSGLPSFPRTQQTNCDDNEWTVMNHSVWDLPAVGCTWLLNSLLTAHGSYKIPAVWLKQCPAYFSSLIHNIDCHASVSY